MFPPSPWNAKSSRNSLENTPSPSPSPSTHVNAGTQIPGTIAGTTTNPRMDVVNGETVIVETNEVPKSRSSGCNKGPSTCMHLGSGDPPSEEQAPSGTNSRARLTESGSWTQHHFWGLSTQKSCSGGGTKRIEECGGEYYYEGRGLIRTNSTMVPFVGNMVGASSARFHTPAAAEIGHMMSPISCAKVGNLISSPARNRNFNRHVISLPTATDLGHGKGQGAELHHHRHHRRNWLATSFDQEMANYESQIAQTALANVMRQVPARSLSETMLEGVGQKAKLATTSSTSAADLSLALIRGPPSTPDPTISASKSLTITRSSPHDGSPSELDRSDTSMSSAELSLSIQSRQNPGDLCKVYTWIEPLRFLLRKGLTVSDVGELGRVVLPKKAAECHLPQVDVKEGVLMPMVDHDCMKRWVFRYKWWLNNKSRMYVLENTGDFMKYHDLKEKDAMTLYEDGVGTFVVRGESRNMLTEDLSFAAAPSDLQAVIAQYASPSTLSRDYINLVTAPIHLMKPFRRPNAPEVMSDVISEHHTYEAKTLLDLVEVGANVLNRDLQHGPSL